MSDRRWRCSRDPCRDSTEAGSNLLILSVTDGFFWRSEIPLVPVIGPLSDPRPLPYRPLPGPVRLGFLDAEKERFFIVI